MLVFGCADIEIPRYAWYKREGDSAIVGCEGQDVTWSLKCEGSQWTGVMGDCSENSKESCSKKLLDNSVSIFVYHLVAASVQESLAWESPKFGK